MTAEIIDNVRHLGYSYKMSKFILFLITTVIHRDTTSHIWPAAVSVSLSAAGESSALGFA